MLKRSFKWNDETTAEMLRMRGEGQTAAQIAEAFAEVYANPPSRNAVLGRARRKGACKTSPPGLARRKKRFVWNDVTLARFRELVEEGFQPFEISARMRQSFPHLPQLSPSAISTKASEIGVEIRGRRARPSLLPKPARVAEPHIEIAPEPEPIIFAQREPEPNAGGLITLMEIRNGRCRYPVGMPDPDRGQMFCGESSDPAESYCPKCYALTHTRPVKRTQAQIEADHIRRMLARKRNAALGGSIWGGNRERAHVV